MSTSSAASPEDDHGENAKDDSVENSEDLPMVNPDDDATLRNLIERIRNGDQAAARVLFETYGPVVRSMARVQFTDPWVRSHFDSEDILITVMRSFYDELATPGNAFVVDTPGQLMAWLVTVTRRKYIDYLRRLLGSNYRRPVARDDHGLDELAAARVNGDEIGCRDLVSAIRVRLPPFERWMLDERLKESTWPVIRDESGYTNQTPQALSNRLRRAVREVLRDLGFSEDLELLEDDDEASGDES